MIYKCDEYEVVVNEIKESNKNIVIYGAGMIGQIIIPYLIQEYQLFDNVLYFIDADEKKQGMTITIGNREYSVCSPDVLQKLPDNTVIFLTNSNYYPVVKMFDEISKLDETECYIIPMIQVIKSQNNYRKHDNRLCSEQMIPKKIHYCWFSRNPIPDYLMKCIESWHKFCPDYEIIRWDEDNYDVNSNLYMKQAYEAKKWGFVPDVARLDILYRYGGIYIDTDVELIRNLDDLLYQTAFVGVEKWGNINMGGCSGAVPHHPMIKKMLDYRIDEHFILEDGSYNQTTCGYYETNPLIKCGMKPDNTTQIINDMTIYSSDFFHPYDYMSGETTITENTFSVHHFNGGWLDTDKYDERKKTVELYKEMMGRCRCRQ